MCIRWIALIVLLVANIISPLPSSSGREVAIRKTATSIWDILQPHFANFINTVFADEHIFKNFDQYLKGVFDIPETTSNQIESASNETVVFEKRPGSRWGSQLNFASNGLTGFLEGASKQLVQAVIQNKDTSIMIPSSQIGLANIITSFKSFIDYESTDHDEEPKKKKKKKKKKKNKTQEVIAPN
ncbi:uncharacterized protein LOC116182917 isoform X2 [Photinus pyralis]|uniref:uncharacterized protein LOC116166950 isoform X2 n=1 Tax=Photinus pyralis TaxID=7054 RepID=UPI001266F97B|nr:uncharacterized protein LOC116166950 isoform X2 [Photinus pyralis]XP_031359342.1 uncharacterized protein LOC116182917 isoform X2 [Photinus pyralis]